MTMGDDPLLESNKQQEKSDCKGVWEAHLQGQSTSSVKLLWLLIHTRFEDPIRATVHNNKANVMPPKRNLQLEKQRLYDHERFLEAHLHGQSMSSAKFSDFQTVTYSIALASRIGAPFVDPIQYAVVNGKKSKREMMHADMAIGTYECLWNENRVSQIPLKSFPSLGLHDPCVDALRWP
jgi:hypothetical protein